jgi:arsenate reductase (thioredoxin)
MRAWSLAAWMAVLSSTAAAQAARAPVPDSGRIVFVCEHGSVKSVLAVAYFRELAREKGLAYRAISRGMAPDTALPPFMRDGLRRDGLSLGAFTPTRFSDADVRSALLVVSFDEPNVATTANGRVPTVAWDNLPAVSANYDVARDSIKHRVALLVDSLARVHPPRPSQRRP